MQSKFLLPVILGFFLLGVAACTYADTAPVPPEPTAFFSQVVAGPKTFAVATSVPTTVPTEEASADASQDIARPSNPGGPGPAAALTGNAVAGKSIFVANCVKCHADEGKGGIANAGSDDGTVPPLNPIDETLVSSDPHIFATNLDLFLEHGSTPAGPSPVLSMPAWGDSGKLQPQQIADVIAYVMSLNGSTETTQGPAPAASQTPAEPEPTEEAARPSNPGGPGPALSLTGDPNSGQQIFSANCQVCHNTEGKGGNPNPGSVDGSIPPLNPIDPTIKDPDPKVFANNIDLFVEHGSTPEGPGPTFSMPAWGDKQLLTPQQIADVIAYVMSLNK